MDSQFNIRYHFTRLIYTELVKLSSEIMRDNTQKKLRRFLAVFYVDDSFVINLFNRFVLKEKLFIIQITNFTDEII